MVPVIGAEEITVQSELYSMAYSKFLLPCRTWLAELTDNLSREGSGKRGQIAVLRQVVLILCKVSSCQGIFL